MESCDFLDLLREGGHLPEMSMPQGERTFKDIEGTTILAVSYRDGVLVAGDRRATMGTLVVYDRADKVLSIDDDSVMAISGSPAMAYEIARMLEMSVQYYRRSQLQKLSLDGKLRTLSRLLRQNLSMAMQGVGAVIPIYAAYDERDEKGKIFFYDLLGATFESVDFCTTGSGSHIIRGALYYLNRWGETPLAEMDEAAALELVIKMLETAAEFDTATGGYRDAARIFPTIMRVGASGISPVSEDEMEAIFQGRMG
jgi:proteasome beta subunit